MLEIKRSHILGVSLGGCIAQAIALKHPERVDRLILVSAAAKFPTITVQILQTWARMLEEVENEAMDLKLRLRAQLPWMFTDAFFQDNQQVDELMNQTLQHPYQLTVTGFSGQVNACVTHDLRDRLQQINTSSLVLVGEADLLTPVGLSQALSSSLSHAKLQVIAAAGHNFFWENLQAFNQAVLNFLKT